MIVFPFLKSSSIQFLQIKFVKVEREKDNGIERLAYLNYRNEVTGS